MAQLRRLFEPIKLGGVELKNRICMLPMVVGYADDHKVTDKLIDFYSTRAKGGVSLITIGTMSVSDVSSCTFYYQLFNLTLGIYTDQLIPGLCKLTASIHDNGAKTCAQLSTGFEWRKSKGAPLEAVAASDGDHNPFTPPTRALTIGEIHQIVEEYGEAARRAYEANFDAVEISGHILSRFLSPATNKRTDDYGGSTENRMRFLLEIITAIRRNTSDDYTIGVRLTVVDFKLGGITIEESKRMASILEKVNTDYITTYIGTYESPVPTVQALVPPGAFVSLAQELKSATDVPIIASNRINSPLLAESILAKGKADLVGMARALIADPELPNKAMKGMFQEIRPCIACCNCIDNIFQAKDVTCATNSSVEKEIDFAKEKPVEKSRKVLIIGAGPSGMEAARVAASRGHKVTMVDRAPRLGGLMVLACILNPELEKYVSYMSYQIKKLPIELKMGVEANASYLKQIKPDAVVMATGGIPYPLDDILGVKRDNVISLQDIRSFMVGLPPKKKGILNRVLWCTSTNYIKHFYNPRILRWLLKLSFPFGKRVAVIGGGFAGCEVAQFLVGRGKQVTLIETSGLIGSDIGINNRWVVMQELKKRKVRIETNARVIEIVEGGVRIGSGSTSSLVTADTIVLATGLRADERFRQEIHHVAPILYLIGDSLKAGRVAEAVASGFYLASEI